MWVITLINLPSGCTAFSIFYSQLLPTSVLYIWNLSTKTASYFKSGPFLISYNKMVRVYPETLSDRFCLGENVIFGFEKSYKGTWRKCQAGTGVSDSICNSVQCPFLRSATIYMWNVNDKVNVWNHRRSQFWPMGPTFTSLSTDEASVVKYLAWRHNPEFESCNLMIAAQRSDSQSNALTRLAIPAPLCGVLYCIVSLDKMSKLKLVVN